MAAPKTKGSTAIQSRPFDPQRWSEVQELQNCLDRLCTELTECEDRKRKRSTAVQSDFQNCVKAIVLDLYCAHVTDPQLTVGIPLGQTYLQDKTNSRYSPAFISARAFRAALHALTAQVFVRCVTRGHRDHTTRTGKVGRYRASKKLIAILEGCGTSISWIIKRPDAEGIILKDKTKKRASYGDVLYANEVRERLGIINKRLRQHWYDLELPDEVRDRMLRKKGKRNDEAAHPLDLSARQLHRVFNNSSWEDGGRFYGGWWQSVPKELRRYITIDGQKTVEADYSGLHAAMLFAQVGLDVPEDPYARCFPNSTSDELRTIVKTTFNALLNAKSVKGLSKLDKYDDQLSGMNWTDFKKHVVSCFPELRDHIGTGVGITLQRKDSELAEKVMLMFCDMQYPCLPVHDSFLVHYALDDDLNNSMQEAFNELFGRRINIKLKRSSVEYDNMDYTEIDIGKIFSEQGPAGRLSKWFSQ